MATRARNAEGRAGRVHRRASGAAAVVAALALGGLSARTCVAQIDAGIPPAAPASAALPSNTPAPVNAYGELQDPALQSRFERITQNLRCLVCQNESIADSNVELAADLRRQVREMLVAGASDDGIFKFMTDRYGEFVRFNPPLEPKTLFIWGAPFLALVLAAVIVTRVARRRSHMPLDDDAPGPA
jgi:cytochrome c-type biogenesis protein CcmH